MAGRGLRRASEHAVHRGPERARGIGGRPSAAPRDVRVGADEHGALVVDLVRVLPGVVGIGERVSAADRVGDEGWVGRPGDRPAAARQASPRRPARRTTRAPKRSIVDRRAPSRSSHTCGARRPGRAEGTYWVTGLSSSGGDVPSGITAADSYDAPKIRPCSLRTRAAAARRRAGARCGPSTASWRGSPR